jgi:hypothetical protein
VSLDVSMIGSSLKRLNYYSKTYDEFIIDSLKTILDHLLVDESESVVFTDNLFGFLWYFAHNPKKHEKEYLIILQGLRDRFLLDYKKIRFNSFCKLLDIFGDFGLIGNETG